MNEKSGVNKMGIKKMVVLGLGQRGNLYAEFAVKNPDKYQLVAIIDNGVNGIEKAQTRFPQIPLYTDYLHFLAQKIPVDLVAIATQDEQHKEHAIAFMKAGYDLLLEKPIANNEEDCLSIYEASKQYQRKVIVCHVLRYTPFYSKVKQLITSGSLGDVITVNASENVGFYHQAHSFVRGPWRNKAQSSPMILAKCCHDMDIIRYLIDEKCLSVNSYGSLSFFNKEHAPKGATAYCSDCPVKDCIYNAYRLYTSTYASWCRSYFVNREVSDEELKEILRHNPYDRCVFGCDNDVVDHQVTIMQFAKGITASHTMTAFSKDIYRDLKVHGTKAELVGSIESNYLEVRHFGGEVDKIHIDLNAVTMGGHSGGDFMMMNNIYKVLNGEQAEGVTYLDVSIDSHLMAFAAERSRLHQGQTEKIEK